MLMVIVEQSSLCNKDEMVLIKVAGIATRDITQQYRDIRDKKKVPLQLRQAINVPLTIFNCYFKKSDFTSL